MKFVMENTVFCRIIIYSRDVEWYFGTSNRNARRLISMVQDAYGRRPSGLVTMKEFCEYHDFDYDDMRHALMKRDREQGR